METIGSTSGEQAFMWQENAIGKSGWATSAANLFKSLFGWFPLIDMQIYRWQNRILNTNYQLFSYAKTKAGALKPLILLGF